MIQQEEEKKESANAIDTERQPLAKGAKSEREPARFEIIEQERGAPL